MRVLEIVLLSALVVVLVAGVGVLVAAIRVKRYAAEIEDRLDWEARKAERERQQAEWIRRYGPPPAPPRPPYPPSIKPDRGVPSP